MALHTCGCIPVVRYFVAPAGGAAYTAGYTHKTSDQLGEFADGMSSVGQEAAQSFGAIIGSVQNGWNSQARLSPPPPAPTVTHVYHDRGSDRSSLVPILVVTASGVTCYWVVCWYKGWDFFGMSHARTQELITSFNASVFPIWLSGLVCNSLQLIPVIYRCCAALSPQVFLTTTT